MDVNFSGLPSSVNTGEEITINVNLGCSGCGDSYLRGVFYESGTKYFGKTLNNSNEWVSTSGDKTVYFKVAKEEFVNASWSGQLKVKIDSDDSNLNGPKDYYFKIGRYTSSGDSSADWSTESKVYINASTPSPSPAPTTAPTSTPSPTKTSTPKPTPTKTSTPKSTSSPEESEVPEFKVTNVSVDEASETSTPEGLVAGAKTSKFPFQAIGLVVSGLGLMGYGGYTYFTKKKHESKKTF